LPPQARRALVSKVLAMTTEKKDDDFLSDMLSPPGPVGTDNLVACFPGLNPDGSKGVEARERAYFANPLNHLPIPFEEAGGECDALAPHELEMIAAFNVRYGVAFSENDWRALNGYEPLPLTEKE
jgi:hypothetical protein